MDEFRFTKNHRPDQLHDELALSFGSRIITIRSSGSDNSTLMFQSGSVVHDGTISDSSIKAILDRHVPVKRNEEKIRLSEVNPVISDLESGTATFVQVQGILAKILRHLRNEAV